MSNDVAVRYERPAISEASLDHLRASAARDLREVGRLMGRADRLSRVKAASLADRAAATLRGANVPITRVALKKCYNCHDYTGHKCLTCGRLVCPGCKGDHVKIYHLL